MLAIMQKSLRYYYGNQTDRDEIPIYKSNTVYNRIFEGTETIVPILSGTSHQFLAIPGEQSEVSIKNAEALQLVLTRKYTDLDMPKHIENVARNMIIKRFGVLEWGWNAEIDDIGVWDIDPRTVLVPRLRVDAHDLPYVIIIEEYDRHDFQENFDYDVDKLTMGRTGSMLDTGGDGKTSNDVYVVLRTMTNNYWTWTQNNQVIKRKVNPYYDYEGEEQENTKRGKRGNKITIATTKYFNHLDRPVKPLVFFTPFTTGDAPLPMTCLCEIAIPIQDDINTQKRQIVNNLVKMGNGQV